MTQLVEGQHYEGRGFDSRRGSLGYFNDFNPSGRTMPLGVNSASNRNEYQGYQVGGGKAASA